MLPVHDVGKDTPNTLPQTIYLCTANEHRLVKACMLFDGEIKK